MRRNDRSTTSTRTRSAGWRSAFANGASTAPGAELAPDTGRMTFDPEEGRPTGESWIDRERRVAAEVAAADALAKSAAEHAHEARMARLRAVGCDDGTGRCLWCRIELGVDAEHVATHPDNGCAGPPPRCSECGTGYVLVDERWQPFCSPADHERYAATASAVASRRAQLTAPDLAPPRRVRRDIDDVD